ENRCGPVSDLPGSGLVHDVLHCLVERAAAKSTPGASAAQTAPFHSFRRATVVPLNLSRSHRPMPSTVCGSGPRPPSVYCHIVHAAQFGGTTAVGPYCASQNQQFASTGSVRVPSSSLMK